MNLRPDGNMSPSPAWIDEVARLANTNSDGIKVPFLKDEEKGRRAPVGSTFRFQETSGAGEVMMAALIAADERATQVAIHADLVDALQTATLKMNWTTAIVALADYAMDRLEGKEIHFTARDPEKTRGPMLTWKTPAGSTRIFIDGNLPVSSVDARGKQQRWRISIPLDVRRRIEKAIPQESVPFTHALMALAFFALDDLRRRKKRLAITNAAD